MGFAALVYAEKACRVLLPRRALLLLALARDDAAALDGEREAAVLER
jgi:hypothetical protein